MQRKKNETRLPRPDFSNEPPGRPAVMLPVRPVSRGTLMIPSVIPVTPRKRATKVMLGFILMNF